jgi:hypothetical protein
MSMPHRGIVCLATAVAIAASASALVASEPEAIMPLDRYTTPKARALGDTHQAQLRELYDSVYHCLPWVGVAEHGIGFRAPKGAPADDRYLSVWITVDQQDDARWGALPAERRASAMFSRYGVDLLRRMAALRPVVEDGNVRGFAVVLSWLKPGTAGRPGVQPVSETLALFVDKASALDLLRLRVSAQEFVRRARLMLFDGTEARGRVPLEIWPDDFTRTFRPQGYEPPADRRC